MIMINGNWEKVTSTDDIIKIIRENFNSELADELYNLLPIHTEEEYELLEEEKQSLNKKIDELYTQISDLESEIKTSENQTELIQLRLKNFAKYLDKVIDTELTKMPLSPEDAIRKSSYCLGLERDKNSIYQILDGKDFDYKGED